MKIAVMQSYFLPYIGYFQLIKAVDKFVVYDNIEFTKKGWINRNRVLLNGKDEFVTLPLKKDSDYLNIAQRRLSDTFKTERVKLLRRISGSYRTAPQFEKVFPLIEGIFNTDDENLFDFIYQSLQMVCQFLHIKTEFVISSTLAIDHRLKSQDKVIAICKELNASQYINPIGGIALYSKEVFNKSNVELNFMKSDTIEYQQFTNPFIPWLSIIDVMMFNSEEKIQHYLQSFSILK